MERIEKFDAVMGQVDPEREKALFGVVVKEGSVLGNVYKYFTVEDLELMEACFDGKGFQCGVFNHLDDKEKWKKAEEILTEMQTWFNTIKKGLENDTNSTVSEERANIMKFVNLIESIE